jgi:uncharacterized protein YgiM (DUF1202 family)
MRFKTLSWIFGAFTLLLALVAGCGGDEGETTPTTPPDSRPPTVQISQPLDQAILPAGQVVSIEVVANDDVSVARIELYVDEFLVESRVVPVGSTLTAWRETFNWSASMVGAHTLQARAHDAAGQVGTSPPVAVTVSLEGQAPGAATPLPQATSPPPEATATFPPLPTTPSEPPLVTASVNANVRSGPGTDYGVIGALQASENARVSGRNADSSWWQIEFQGGVGWIADVVVTANAPAREASVVSASAPPPTNTPLPPTATAAPTAAATPAPTTGLRVDHTALSAGQCTTLRWDFDGIEAVYVVFGFGYDEDGVGGHGSEQVCPSVTTTYKARVVNQDDTVHTHEVTVNVSGNACGDPVIERFVSTTYDVDVNEPFSVFWDVRCTEGVWLIIGDGAQEAVNLSGSEISVRITADTTFWLKVAKGEASFVYASFKVRIK